MKISSILIAIAIICILFSCKKTSSSNSSNQSLLYGNWSIVNDSSIVIQSSISPFPNFYSNSFGITQAGEQYEIFLQNGQFIDGGPVGGYSSPWRDTTTWKFVSTNQLVIGTANYFNNVLEDTQDSVTITHLDAHNLSYTSIVHEYNSTDSIYIDYYNLTK